MRWISTVVCLLSVAACSPAAERSQAAGAADTAFASMQERGKAAMGVDQYTSSHIFASLPDGGRIVLQRDDADSAGTEAIRAHLSSIAVAFSAGQFDIPGFVHAQTVPGTAVMAAQRATLTYVMDTLPRGGEVRIHSSDSTSVLAIHEFLAFQRDAHHAMAHENAP